MPYVKLDAGILDSTLWVQDAATCKVFITMLAMCDPDGLCPATAPGIARRSNLDLEECRRALAILEAPDDDSRSSECEGRRILRCDGGYQIVNYLKYRTKEYHQVAKGETKGYIYFVSDNSETVKIGFSKNPWARLSDLRVSRPGLQLLGSVQGTLYDEKNMHKQYDSFRLQGEWFRLDGELLEFLSGLANYRSYLSYSSNYEKGEGKGNVNKEEKAYVVSEANDPCPHQEIIKLYHQKLPMCPSVRIWDQRRQSLLRARWKEDKDRQDLDWWAQYFDYVSQSAFLTGRTQKPFFADLEWLVSPKNFIKVYEGKYHNG